MKDELFKMKLKEIGITQLQLAIELGISSQHLIGIRKGQREASLELVLKICNYLQLNPFEYAPEYSDLLNKAIQLSNNNNNNIYNSSGFQMENISEENSIYKLTMSNSNLSESIKNMSQSKVVDSNTIYELSHQLSEINKVLLSNFNKK